MTKFDIIIPTTEKDLDTLEECIKSAKLFIDGYRKIIVISKERYTKNADWFPESNFPFSLENLTILSRWWSPPPNVLACLMPPLCGTQS